MLLTRILVSLKLLAYFTCISAHPLSTFKPLNRRSEYLELGPIVREGYKRARTVVEAPRDERVKARIPEELYGYSMLKDEKPIIKLEQSNGIPVASEVSNGMKARIPEELNQHSILKDEKPIIKQEKSNGIPLASGVSNGMKARIPEELNQHSILKDEKPIIKQEKSNGIPLASGVSNEVPLEEIFDEEQLLFLHQIGEELINNPKMSSILDLYSLRSIKRKALIEESSALENSNEGQNPTTEDIFEEWNDQILKKLVAIKSGPSYSKPSSHE